jgi:NADPH2:quinone reductase
MICANPWQKIILNNLFILSKKETMKAIRVNTPGDASVLSYEDVALPAPAANEARVKIAAAGLNFIDIYQRKGAYKMPLPFTLGQEAAGVVEAVGADVTEVKVGDRVAYASIIGAYAEAANVPAARLVPVPDAVSLDQAAAVMLQGMTAHYLATSTYPLKQGSTCVVHAAAGGAGLLLTQIAKLRGAFVIGTMSTEEKAALAKKAGADETILYTQQDFEQEVKRITEGQGVDVVYDSVGKDTFAKSMNCLKPRGYMVLWGQASGPVEPLDPQILNAKGSLFLTRPSLGSYTQTRDELLARAGDLFDWMSAGKLNVRIDQTFALRDAGEAHRYMEGRHTKGKVLLIP